MWKKIILSVIIIVILVVGIELFTTTKNKKNEDENNMVNEVENLVEISAEYVTDDCINEWEDYAISRQEELEEANQNIGDENRHYIVKIQDNCINVYYINEKEEEILYKKAEIPIEYLPKEDIEKLNAGIDIYGIEELNKLLEDFE